jgi:hypothetical protein
MGYQGWQAPGVVIVGVADGDCLNRLWIDLQQFQVVQQDRLALARVEQQTPAFRLDQETQPMLAPVGRAELDGIVNDTD